MRTYIIIITFGVAVMLSNCNSVSKDEAENISNNSGEVIALTNESFKQNVFNYDQNEKWKFEGDLPVIIDFYAPWCKPCHELSPIVEEIAKEYAGKITVYKVDIDTEKLIAQNLGIRNLPTIYFIPVEGQPRSAKGLMPKGEIVRAINEVLLVK